MFHSKFKLLIASSFLFLLVTNTSPSIAQNKKIEPAKLNSWAGQLVVRRVERLIGHRLDWKRRQQLVTKAKIMSDTIDKSNKEFSSQIQRAFHMGISEIKSLNSQAIAGRMYGNEALIERRIVLSRKKPLSSYEKRQIKSLVNTRDKVQTKAREKMAYEIQGTVGIPYSEALSMVSPRPNMLELKPKQDGRNTSWSDRLRQRNR